MKPQNSEKGFAAELSYILIGGVVLSLITEIIGLLLYYAQTRGLNFDYAVQWQLTGPNFFAYIASFFSNTSTNTGPMRVMALGIIILMLTPYVRVLASAIHFAASKNLKYLLFTGFVLLILTLSLSLR